MGMLYYALGYFCIFSFGLFKIPVITNFFKPEQLGNYFLINSFLTYIDVLFLSWINGTIWRHVHDNRFPTYNSLVSSIIPIFGIAVILSLCTTILLSLLLNLWDIQIILIAFFTSLSGQVISLYGSYLLYKTNVKHWSMLVCIQNICSFLLLVVLMLNETSIINIFLSVLITNILILFFYITPKHFRTRSFSIHFEKNTYKSLLSYSLILIVTNICITVLNNGDRFLIQHFKGEKSLGIYAQNYSLATVGFFSFIQAFTTLFLPTFMKGIAAKAENGINSKIVRMYLLFFTPTFCFLLVNSFRITELLLGDEFRGYASIFNWVLAGTYCLGFANFFETRLKFLNKIKLVSFSFFAIAIINLLINFILLKIYSINVSAIITFGSYFILLVLFLWFDRPYFQNLQIGSLILKLAVASSIYFFLSMLVKHFLPNNLLAFFSDAFICFATYFIFLKRQFLEIGDVLHKALNSATNYNVTTTK